MPTYLVLQPCKIRETHFVVDRKRDRIRYDWPQLVGLFLGHLKPGSEERRTAARTLRSVARTGFLGLATARGGDQPHLFVFQGQGGSDDFRAVVARDETFANRVREVYRVEETHWEVEREEAVGDEPFKPVRASADHVVQG